MQQRLEETHNDFISAVASGRGVRASDEIRSQRFGEGRMFSANEAQRLGLVDKIQSAADYYGSVTPAPEPETPRFGLAEDVKKKTVLSQRGKFTKALPE
jgi:ClpP class serine protease